MFFIVLSLFVQRKNQRKGAGNDKFWLAVRPLHWPYWRYRPAKISHHFRVACAQLKNKPVNALRSTLYAQRFTLYALRFHLLSCDFCLLS
jgi:hypothetical protein